MKYLFAFSDVEGCRWLQRALALEDIVCEIHNAREFPDGRQGPEVWVRDEDYNHAQRIFADLQRER